MAPIAHLKQSSSRCGVSNDIKQLNAPHFAHLGDQQVEFQCSAAVEFALSQWNCVSSRPHYTVDKNGIPVLVVALPTSNAEKQILKPIQEVESSSGPAKSIKVTATVKESSVETYSVPLSDSCDTPSLASSGAIISITSSNDESNNKVSSQLSCSNLDAEIDENNAIISQKVSQFTFLIDAIEAEMEKFKIKDQIQQTETASRDTDIDENNVIISQNIINPLTVLKLTDASFLNSELVLQDMELDKCYNKISDLQNEVTILKGNLEQLVDDREKNQIKDRPLTIYVTREWHEKEMQEFALRVTRDHNEFLHGFADQAETLIAEHSRLCEGVAERDRIISDQRNDISTLRIDLNSVTDAHMEELAERDRMISILNKENENLRARLTAAEAHPTTIISQFPTVKSTPPKPPKTLFRKFKSNCSKVVRQTQQTLRGLLPQRN